METGTMENLQKRISDKAASLRDEIIRIRRTIYMYPELSGDERRTSQLVADKLRSTGMEVQTNIGGYGVVGTLNGGKKGATVAWRADMDACAMRDAIDKPYRSRIDGVKHVCGHDAHTAVALGIAETLASIREELPGGIRFIFQPYEEGTEGASRMIQAGALENPKPSAIYGLHVTNWGLNQTYLKAGQLTVNFGAALFGRNLFDVSVKVRRDDVILSTEQDVLIHALNRLNKYDIRCGKESQNVVDFRILAKDSLFKNNEIRLRASYRFARKEFADEIGEELKRLIDEYKKNNDYEVTVEPVRLMPPVYNDETESEEAFRFFRRLIGDNAVAVRNEFPPHGMDDFALFRQELAGGLFFFLGMANVEKGIKVGMHTPDFDIDEDCLEFGARTMSLFLFDLLQKQAGVAG